MARPARHVRRGASAVPDAGPVADVFIGWLMPRTSTAGTGLFAPLDTHISLSGAKGRYPADEERVNKSVVAPLGEVPGDDWPWK